MACPRSGVSEVLFPNGWIGPPITEGRRFGGSVMPGVVFTSMRDWYENGVLIIHAVPNLWCVSITDRSPMVVEIEEDTGLDRGHAEYEGRRGQTWVRGYGWIHGTRWQDDPADVPAAAYHLPREIFAELMDCEFEAIVRDRRSGRSTMPRWGTPGAAMAVMNVAAWNWAVDGGRKS